MTQRSPSRTCVLICSCKADSGSLTLRPHFSCVSTAMQHPSELKIIEIAQRYLMVSMQANQAYQAQQNALELDVVLSRERLQTAEGTVLSLDALSRLVALTQAHKAAFQAVLLASSSEIAAATAELPPALRGQYSARFLETTQWQLDAQSRFYANREHWISTALDICALIEARRATCTFSEHGVRFHDDADLALFDLLMARLHDAHCIETEAYELRTERMRRALGVLGITAG